MFYSHDMAWVALVRYALCLALGAGVTYGVNGHWWVSVLTVAAHLERGTCCNSGCRHCPFVEN